MMVAAAVAVVFAFIGIDSPIVTVGMESRSRTLCSEVSRSRDRDCDVAKSALKVDVVGGGVAVDGGNDDDDDDDDDVVVLSIKNDGL